MTKLLGRWAYFFLPKSKCLVQLLLWAEVAAATQSAAAATAASQRGRRECAVEPFTASPELWMERERVRSGEGLRTRKSTLLPVRLCRSPFFPRLAVAVVAPARKGPARAGAAVAAPCAVVRPMSDRRTRERLTLERESVAWRTMAGMPRIPRERASTTSRLPEYGRFKQPHSSPHNRIGIDVRFIRRVIRPNKRTA